MALQFKLTRIAPTPSGFLHLGNVLSFALTAAIARQAGARILLRIDDMDRERAGKEYVQDIFDTLQFLEIPWDEGPRNYQEFEKEFSQLHRLPLYEKALLQLKQQGAVFACTCSRAKVLSESPDGVYPGTCRNKGIPLDAKGACWRLQTDNRELAVKTIEQGTISAVLPGSLKDFVVRKKDGYPAYQLTSLVDDLYWEVDLIVRGEDLWPSTLAQQYLAAVLNKPAFGGIHFFHHSLLAGRDGQKFSKSAGATSIQFLRKEGKKTADIYGMIAEMMNLAGTVDNPESLARALGII